MCYNSPDTIYYRQARAIQEVAKKDFENLRQDSDASEPEPEPEPLPEPEPKPQRRRGRPPKNTVKQKVGRPPAERATADFSGATVATAGNSGHHAHLGFDLQRRMADVLKASFANRNNEQNWSSERKLERIEDYSGYAYVMSLTELCPLNGSAFNEVLLNKRHRSNLTPNIIDVFPPLFQGPGVNGQEKWGRSHLW
jgi:bromodomain-containing protein 7/9